MSSLAKQDHIVKIVEEKLKDTNKFLVEVSVQPGNFITVFIDGDDPVSISDCRELSRFIEGRLDRENGDFQLTVSSAGMDRPIKLLRQYKNRIGKALEVVTFAGERISGILAGADEKAIELEHPVKKPGKEIKKQNSIITHDRIKSAKIIITFD